MVRVHVEKRYEDQKIVGQCDICFEEIEEELNPETGRFYFDCENPNCKIKYNLPWPWRTSIIFKNEGEHISFNLRPQKQPE